MKNHHRGALLLAGFACLLLAGCSAKDETPAETSYQSLVKLAASDAADGDNFGYIVAIDGSYAIVGAPGVDASGAGRGAAYLYLKSQGGADGWGQVKTLVASDAADNDYFGVAVDISGDYAVVGAGAENGSGTNQGAAYIFYRNQGGTDNWGEVKRIVAAVREDEAGFGYAVAIDGDTVIVGSDGEDGDGADQGAAYIFYRDQGGADNWGQVVRLVSGDPNDVDQFGFAVDVQGDSAIVGSYREDGDGSDRGAAYVFARDLGGSDAWGLVKRIVPTDPADETWFGSTVAIDGTLAVVGAAWEDSGGTNRGTAYVFGQDRGGTDNWGQVKKLTASDAQNSAMFGYDVAIDGGNVIVGAGWAPGGGTERGQAYVFARDEGGTDNWGEVQRLRASDASNEDWFGFSVAIYGTYVLVGAIGEDGSGSERGAAYIFKKI
jgi:hypothetical protein